MRLDRTAQGEGRVFRLVGDLEGGAVRQLARVLGGPASDGGDLIIDITGMSACDDAGVQALVALTKRARLAEGDVVLVAPAPNIRETLSKAVEAGELRVEDDIVAVQPTP